MPSRRVHEATRSALLRCLTFLALALALAPLLAASALEGLRAGLREVFAQAVGRTLALAGWQVTIREDTVLFLTGSIRVVDSCTGLDVAVFLAAAILVVRAPWRARALGIATGFAVIWALNLLRLLTVSFVLHWEPDHFELVHLGIFPPLTIIVSLATLFLWMRRYATR